MEASDLDVRVMADRVAISGERLSSTHKDRLALDTSHNYPVAVYTIRDQPNCLTSVRDNHDGN